MHAFGITFLFLLAATFALADYEPFRQDLCLDSDKKNELGDYGCFSRCNTRTCLNQFLSDKFDLSSLAVSINSKCDEPLSIKITVKVNGHSGSWSHDMKPGHMVEVPGFPLDPVTRSRSFGGIYLQAQQEDTRELLRFKITFLSSIKDSYGEIEKMFSHGVFADIYTHKKLSCETKRWWSSLSSFSKALVYFVGVIALAVLLIFGYYCCRFLPPQAAATIKSNRETIPMQPLVNEV